MAKKLLSLIISVFLVVSLFGVPTVFANNETEVLPPNTEVNTLPEIADGCNRYFFYMPESWECRYSQDASIFWWEGTGSMKNWPGVKANKADAETTMYLRM